MATTKKSTAGARKGSGTKAPARRPSASKPATPAPTPAAAAPAVPKASGLVQLVSTAKGTRTFHDARGLRRTVVLGEVFELDAATARILLKSDPEAFARAGNVDVPETAPAATGPITVADLGAGGVIAKPADAAPAAEASTATPPVDAAPAASSDGGDQGGSEAVNDPDATATGETATPPASEAPGTETAPAATEPGAEVLS